MNETKKMPSENKETNRMPQKAAFDVKNASQADFLYERV